MANENEGKNPDQAGGVGLEKDPPEVAGRARRLMYVCGVCGAFFGRNFPTDQSRRAQRMTVAALL